MTLVRCTNLNLCRILLRHRLPTPTCMLCCVRKTPVAAFPAAERQDIVYVGNRIRQKGESNGKACNLNNTLRNLYPPGQPVDPNEVGWGEVQAVTSPAWQLPSMTCTDNCAGAHRVKSVVERHMTCNLAANLSFGRQEA